MIPHIVEGGNMVGLMLYLTGPGRANEHEDAHLVAGDDVLMDRWGEWDELSPAQAVEIAHAVDRYMTVFNIRPVGRVRGFDHATGKTVVVDQAPNHVWHCSLSLSPEEGPLTDEVWRAIAAGFMAEMGFTGADGKAACRWVAVRHGRSRNGGDHVHIAANIVRADGTKWSAYRDQKRSQKACNTLEHRYGLRVLESREHARGARADSTADLRASQRQGRRRTDREVLEHRVRAAAVASSSEMDFLVRLRELGVRARPRFAQGRTDVVVGYWVGLHARPGQRTQWYGGGRLARDLSLPRLRARWPDTPGSAQQAVDAWRQAWRGMPPPHHVSSRAELAARVRALDTWAQVLRSTDATDPVTLADTTRDVAGLLSAHALAARDPAAARLLERAARTAGRACQAHRRPAPASEVPQAVSVAASLALSAALSGRADPVVLIAQSLALVEALAALYKTSQQARTAADMLEASRAALEAVTTPTVERDLEALRAEASWQALASTAGPVQEGHHPASQQPPLRPATVAARTTPAATGAGVVSQDRLDQVRSVMARAMPAGTTPPTETARGQSSRSRAGSGPGEPTATGAPDAPGVQVPETVRAVYHRALTATHPTRPPARPAEDPPPPRPGPPASGHRRTR